MKRWKVKPGLKFGRLTVLYRMESSKWGESRVACKCDCGNTCVVLFKCMTRGDTKSCGCYGVERRRQRQFKHGKCNTRAYYCWRNMINRCGWESGQDFKNYGGRGIKICKRWEKFENFYADMGDPPPGMTLERVNNSKGYSKGNCVWATRTEQSKNRRNTRWITFEGRTLHLSEWARIKGIKITTLKMRLDSYGWPLERALCA